MANLLADVETAGVKVGQFLKSIVSGAAKLKLIYGSLSGPVIAASMAVFYDVSKAIAAGQGVASAAASGNVVGAISLSETTVELVKQVVADFKAGEKSVVADFESLGIKL